MALGWKLPESGQRIIWVTSAFGCMKVVKKDCTSQNLLLSGALGNKHGFIPAAVQSVPHYYRKTQEKDITGVDKHATMHQSLQPNYSLKQLEAHHSRS